MDYTPFLAYILEVCTKDSLTHQNHTVKKIPHFWIDLLNPEEEERFLLRPNELSDIIKNLPQKTKWIVIDA